MSSALTLANLLTILRLLLVPVFVIAIYYQEFIWALGLFFGAAITDGLDGFFARAFNQKTQLGTILDPMADKLLLVTAFIVLSSHGMTKTAPIPFWVTVAAISRDIFIVLGALAINVSTGFSQFRPSALGKLNTFVQIVTIAIFLAANAFALDTRFITITCLATFLMALLSGIHYIFHANRLLNEKSGELPK
jgi:cardiolipin synthase (CMP-forming)